MLSVYALENDPTHTAQRFINQTFLLYISIFIIFKKLFQYFTLHIFTAAMKFYFSLVFIYNVYEKETNYLLSRLRGEAVGLV